MHFFAPKEYNTLTKKAKDYAWEYFSDDSASVDRPQAHSHIG